MDLVVTVPVNASLPHLIGELGEVCEALNIDWTLTPLVAEGMDELRTADR